MAKTAIHVKLDLMKKIFFNSQKFIPAKYFFFNIRELLSKKMILKSKKHNWIWQGILSLDPNKMFLNQFFSPESFSTKFVYFGY